MGIILILAQVTLAVLVYGAHVVSLSPWLICLPAVLLATLWLLAQMLRCTLMLDTVNPFMKRRRR